MSGLVITAKVTIREAAFQLIEADGKRLVGQCNQCGECCKFHPNLPPGVPYPNIKTKVCTKLDPITNKCSIYHLRPITCALYPTPDIILPDKCGFRWVEV